MVTCTQKFWYNNLKFMNQYKILWGLCSKMIYVFESAPQTQKWSYVFFKNITFLDQYKSMIWIPLYTFPCKLGVE
jgi:hypothetical protein